MGIKLEYILIILISIIIYFAMTVKLENSTSLHKNDNKELEFTNTTFIEVDKKKMRAKAYGTYGVRQNGIFTLDDVEYSTNKIKQLLANKGVYKNNILYLDGNVSLKQKNGFRYTTQHANYNQKSEVLYITSPFIAHINKNIVHGDTLVYYTLKEEANATNIDAVIYPSKK